MEFINSRIVPIMAIVMVVTGTINSLLIKTLSNHFMFGFSLSLPMFLGEYFNFLILIVPLFFSIGSRAQHFAELKADAKKTGKKLDAPWYYIGFGGCLDALGSSLQNIALLLLPASIQQMLRSGVMIFVVIFTIFYLKKKVFRHQLLGVAIITLGFTLVGSASFFKANGTKSINLFNTFIGLAIILISLIFSGFQFTYQELMIDRYEFDLKRLVGLESIFGFVTLTVLLFITSKINCPDASVCLDSLDDPSQAIKLLGHKPMLLFLSICIAFSVMLFNLSGVWLTKKVSSVYRIIMDSIRTVLIWIILLLLGLESFNPKSFAFQGPGFLLLILGNLIFNKIIKINLGDDVPTENQEAISQ